MLKRLSTQLAPVICRLCKVSMQCGILPSQLKRPLVLPLLKNLPWTQTSHRPISNLLFISKLIERVVLSASLPMYLSLISFRVSSPPTDHFIFSLYWNCSSLNARHSFVPLITARYLYSCNYSCYWTWPECYADDTQLYDCCRFQDVSDVLVELELVSYRSELNGLQACIVLPTGEWVWNILSG